MSFLGQDSQVLSTESFSIRHLRNYEQTPNGATVVSSKGGYTVLADKFGDLFVSKCHPKVDRFCRMAGLTCALERFIAKYFKGYYIAPNQRDGSMFVISLGANRFEVILAPLEEYAPI